MKCPVREECLMDPLVCRGEARARCIETVVLQVMHPEAMARWAEEDDRAFALEAAADASGAIISHESAPDLVEIQPAAHGRRTNGNLLGRTLGGMLVLAEVHRLRKSGAVRRFWRIQCRCGETSLATTDKLLKAPPLRCRRCTAAALNHERVMIDGRPAADVAREIGISPITMRNRRRRGWTGEKLLRPRLRPPTGRAA